MCYSNNLLIKIYRCLRNNMKTLNVIIEDKIAEIKLYGHWIKSNDKTISKDIPCLLYTSRCV